VRLEDRGVALARNAHQEPDLIVEHVRRLAGFARVVPSLGGARLVDARVFPARLVRAGPGSGGGRRVGRRRRHHTTR